MNQRKHYDNIQKFLDNLPGDFSVLEHEVDVGLQMEYFEKSQQTRKSEEVESVLEKKDALFLDTTQIEDKKELLSRIAALGTVDSYRILEEYSKNPDLELKDWAILALNENKLLLESRLLEKSQVFISTGLGGRGEKLRYFMVFLAKSEEFTQVQKKIFGNELSYGAKKYDYEVETLDFNKELAITTILIPIKSNIKNIYQEIIEESNQFGDFLLEDFLVTNVKKLSCKEIRQFINKKENEEDAS